MNPTAKDFPKALRAEISRIAAAGGMPESRIRQWIGFERFLARVPADGSWLLKGSFALEIIFRPSCRPAADLDFTLPKAPRMQYNAPPDIVSIASKDLNDGFHFESTPMEEIIEAWQEGTTYGRGRAEVRCLVGNEEFASFHVDADLGDTPVMEPKELAPRVNLLAFAEIKKSTTLMVPFETQFAEKIHAYTLPNRTAQRNVLHDFVDMILLLDRAEELGAKDYYFHNFNVLTLAFSIDRTFKRRGSHPIPEVLPKLDPSLEPQFNALAVAMNLSSDLPVASWKLTNLWQVLTQIYRYSRIKI